MRLDTLYVRFFRSLNYDYLRKSRDDFSPDPWDSLTADETSPSFPFIRLPLERDITTIVGANEAGKTQVLTAIECLLTGQGIKRSDFCRYSTEFNEEQSPLVPEFGGKFTDLTEDEANRIREEFDADEPARSFHLFRFHDGLEMFAFGRRVTLADLPDWLNLPRPFKIEANTPLPDSVEIAYLASDGTKQARARASWLPKMEFVRRFPDIVKPDYDSRPAYEEEDVRLEDGQQGQWLLAKRLLVDVAGINRSEFEELGKALRISEGYAEALVAKMNRKLADSLNFKRWWSQDSDFALQIRLRDFDLVFTLRDRTGSDYTFNERSQGLKYFLSYFVQYLSHDPSHGQLLLMDEPDAFLSNSGQQDLLRIFTAFAHPDDGRREPVQIIYVTHSPFLIDKNHAERIRVLEKGEGEEGTRVVKNAGRNHYEPLRTALGGFVAETTFISSCNLLLEGQADPILLAGASAVARVVAPTGNALDLNTLTLVPCGGAGNVPYMVHLARGRDEDKPAVLVMVDNDRDGLAAAADVRSKKGLIAPHLVFTVADDESDAPREGVAELEDLIPVPLANMAVVKLARDVLSHDQAQAFVEHWADVAPAPDKKLFKELQVAARSVSEAAGLPRPLALDKVPFARSVVDLALADNADASLNEELYEKFQPLLALIEKKQRDALREHNQARISTVIKRLVRNFKRDRPGGIRKGDALTLLESIQSQVPSEALESDIVSDEVRKIVRDFKLNEEPRSDVLEPDSLRDRLENLVYRVTNSVQTS